MSADELKAKGNAALQSEKYDEAVKYYTEAIQVDPSNHILYSNRSAAYAKTGKYNESLQDAEKTISLKNDWPKGYSRKGAALELLERFDEAVKTYEEGLKYDSNNEQLKEALKNCKDNVESGFTMGGPGGFNPFSDPKFLANLAMNPKTRDLLMDPEVQDLVKGLQKNPNDIAKLLNHPKASQLLGAMFGGMAGNGMNPFGGEEEEEEKPKPPPEPKKPEPKPDPKAHLTPEQRQVFNFIFNETFL
jgi:stress-induced-phosphoprotein 1